MEQPVTALPWAPVQPNSAMQHDVALHKVAGLIQSAYEKLKASDAVEAVDLLERALSLDYENGEIKYALTCVNWWIEYTRRIDGIQNPYEKGAFILSLLRQYYVFLDRIDGSYELCQYAVRRFVFSSALHCFENVLGDGKNEHEPGLLLLVGRCFKGAGNYDEALKYLEQAVRFRREDAETLAELADVYALRGETRTAKVLFREAFFLDPVKIDLRVMESELITRLRDRLAAEKGYGDTDIREWIPVYGRIWGVFTVKRELKQIEAARLKESIFSIETECRSNPDQHQFLKPRLLNRYFWLIDHYESSREEPELIEALLLKIKVIDGEIYKQYTR